MPFKFIEALNKEGKAILNSLLEELFNSQPKNQVITSGQIDLSNIGGIIYDTFTQTGALVLSAAPIVVGGKAIITIKSNGAAITLPGTWIRDGGDNISIVNNDINHITLIAKDRNVVLYRNKAEGVTGKSLAGSLQLTTIGSGITVKEGANATLGEAVLVAGTVTIANTKVTANTKVFITRQVAGGAVGTYAPTARVPGTSFTITSSSGTDTSTVGWFFIEPNL